MAEVIDRLFPPTPAWDHGDVDYRHEVDIKVEMTVLVKCDFDPGCPETRETPKENRGFIPLSVKWRGVDITHCLTEEDMERIEREVNAK